MEEPKSKHERKAMTIKITTGAGGVGGIGGIVFLGGALVAATLVSAFAFKRRTSGRTEQQPKSSPENNDVTVHLTPAVTDLPNDLEMMMKSSKDHHTKGLTFLLPADSSLPFLPKKSSASIDAAAETGVTRIEPTQVLILNNEKAKIKVDGAGDQEMVLPEIHEESTPLFDESGITITKETCLFSVSEASSLEPLIKNIDKSMGSDQQTVCSDGLVPESNGFHNYGVKLKLSSPLVDTPLHSEPESTNEDEYSSTEKLPDFVEAVELPVEEGCEVKSSLPLLDSKLLSESESTNKDELSKENALVYVEAVKLLEEEEDCEGKSSLPLINSAMVFVSESMSNEEFSEEPIPVFSESVGLQVEEYEVKSSLPLFDSAKPETPLISDKAFELLEVDSEANNVGTGYRDQIEVEKELDVCDAIVQEMVQEDVLHEIAHVDQFTDDKETFENYDVEKVESEPLVEPIEVKKEGETFDVECDSIGVGEDKEENPLIEEEEELEEENGNEIVGVDQIIAEVNEEVKLIGEGEKDDEFGEPHGEECRKTSMEAILDQIAEEEEERVEVSEDEETVSNSSVQDELGMCPLTEKELDLSEVVIEAVCLDPIKVEEETEMRLIEEETEEHDDVQGDTIAIKCEDESMETADADGDLENLEDGEKEESEEDIIEDESIQETDDVDELVKSLENGEKDNGSCSLITEQEFSEPMVDSGCFVLDSGKVSPFVEAGDADETALVDHVLVEDNDLQPIQSTEEGTIVESSNEEDSEEESEDEESSEGTEDLSTESKYDAVWPAESIQDLSFKLDQMKTNNQETQGESDNDNDDEIEVETIGSYVKEEVENIQIMEPWKVKSWTLLTLAMIWCLCHWYLDLPYEKVSLVALVISIAIIFGFPNHGVLAKHK